MNRAGGGGAVGSRRMPIGMRTCARRVRSLWGRSGAPLLRTRLRAGPGPLPRLTWQQRSGRGGLRGGNPAYGAARPAAAGAMGGRGRQAAERQPPWSSGGSATLQGPKADRAAARAPRALEPRRTMVGTKPTRLPSFLSCLLHARISSLLVITLIVAMLHVSCQYRNQASDWIDAISMSH